MEKSILGTTVGSVLMVISTLAHGGGVWAGVQASLRMYDEIAPSEIVWGQESAPEEEAFLMDPPLFTGSPGKVEVIEFVRYPQDVWRRSQVLAEAWRKSLPDGVVVRRVPLDWEAGPFGQRGDFRTLLRQQQRVYFAAELLGIEEAAHAALFASGERGDMSVRRAVAEITSATGVDPQEFKRLRNHEMMRARANSALALTQLATEAYIATDVFKDAPWRFPELLINGRYAVSASQMGDPRAAYRLANRLIGEELQNGEKGAWPTNDEEFSQWMGTRSGQLLRSAVFGRELKTYRVYSVARKEMWGISADGKYLGTYKLAGTGARSYHRLNGSSTVRYWEEWRLGRTHMPFERPDGTPQKYGAFLLMDHLCAPDTYWVGLRFKGREVGLAFDRCESGEGRVEGRNANGSIFGSWWLEAGELKVSFGEGGIQSWPWRDVAKQVGWEIPPESVTPWKFEEGYAERETQEVARSSGSER
ncbi:MAG: hypothetical protein OXU81_15555 [Gammaproteobacteria bacterium]|nr:hypothetical protein [Gammaproteobacteria bacterium]